MSEEMTDLQLAVHAARESLEPAYIEAGYLKVCLSETDHADLIHHLREEELFLHDIDPEGWAEIPKPALFFENIDELIRKPQRRRNEPDREYYLLDVNWLSTEEEPPLVIERWRDACHFLELAGEVADHQVERQNELELVFLHQEKLVVEVKFTSSDLVPLACLDELENEFLRSDTHREKKVSIFRSVLTERYKGRGRVQFGELLRDFFRLFESLQNNYDLFVSEFSFENIKSQVERDKLEFTTRLNKVFSDIQNQLLAVPAALLLVGSQMEKADPIGWSLKNVVIWLGAVVFAVLMELLIRNQRNTLQAVKNEMDLQKMIFKDHHRAIYHKFQDVYVELGQRFRHQRNLLCFIRCLVGAALGFTTSMLTVYSVEVSVCYAVLIGAGVGVVPVVLALLNVYQCYRKRRQG